MMTALAQVVSLDKTEKGMIAHLTCEQKQVVIVVNRKNLVAQGLRQKRSAVNLINGA